MSNFYIDDIRYALNDFCFPWHKLENTNILITGATGLIGSAIIDALMQNENRNYCVYASGRNYERACELFSEYFSKDGFYFVSHDITQKLVVNIEFHYIIHAASYASPNHFVSDPVNVFKANVWGVNNLLEYSKDFIKKFIFVSSGEVYGKSNNDILDESYSGYIDPLLPRSCYPISKRAAENLSVSYGVENKFEISIARPCHTFGPHFLKNDGRAYAQFLRNVTNNQDIVLKSDGSQRRSWLYVVDCAMAILCILFYGKDKEAYNVADLDSVCTIKDFAEKMARIAHRKVSFDIPTETEKKGYSTVVSSILGDKKIKMIGWKPFFTLDAGLEHTIKTLNHLK